MIHQVKDFNYCNNTTKVDAIIANTLADTWMDLAQTLADTIVTVGKAALFGVLGPQAAWLSEAMPPVVLPE